MNITFSGPERLSIDKLLELYGSVSWTNYTNDPVRLLAAINASLRVVTAWDGAELVGLARVVGDGLTIVYLQDILVKPDLQHHGYGRELFRRAFEPYGDVRQKLLITDADPAQLAFYAAMGFKNTTELPYKINTFVQFS